MHTKQILIIVVVMAALILSIAPGWAQDGEPPDRENTDTAASGGFDRSFGGFGTSGKVGNAPIDIYATALQADGRIVVAGSQDNVFALARYLPTGEIDTSFGTQGVVKTKIYSLEAGSRANAVAIQSSGKIVAAGFVVIGNENDFAVARYNADGTPDHSFSGDGKATSDFDSGDDTAYAVAIQSNGRIVVAGEVWDRDTLAPDDFDIGVERFNVDGTLDNTFSGNGKTNIGFGDNDGAHAIALQPDGKIVVAGYREDSSCGGLCPPQIDDECFQGTHTLHFDFAVVRLNTNGSLDTTFDQDGKLVTGFGGNECATSVAIQPDGKIVAAGLSVENGFALARYLTNGTLDSSFDGDGKLTTAINAGRVTSIVIQPNGRIVAAGAGLGQFALARYQINGTLDSTFSSDGKVFTDVSTGSDIARGLVMQADGRFVVAGQKYLARYFGDGLLDSGGRQLVAFGLPIANEAAYAMALQPDHKIVVAGYVAESTDQFALARLNTDGTLDPTFDGDGLITFGFGGDERVQAVAVQDDGHIVVAGYVTTVSQGDNFMIARYESDGAFDCFNIIDFNNGDDRPGAVAIQPDGKIVVAGIAYDGAHYNFGVARFKTTCAIDNTFDGDGRQTIGFGNNDYANSVLVLPDGAIMLAGSTGDDILLARLNEDGSPDNTFDGDGKLITQRNVSGVPSVLARQPDGKLLLATTTHSSLDFMVVRYFADGNIDTDFGVDGFSTIDFGGQADTAYAIDVRSDGKIAVAGSSSTALGFTVQFALVQLNPDGTRDNQFSGDGKLTTTFGDLRQFARGVTYSGDDQLVVAGYAAAGSDSNFALARYLTTPLGSADGLHHIYVSVILR